MKGPMRLVDPSSGEMECRVCGSVHWANAKTGGGFEYGSWQCSEQTCQSNVEVWNEDKQQYVKPDWRDIEIAQSAKAAASNR